MWLLRGLWPDLSHENPLAWLIPDDFTWRCNHGVTPGMSQGDRQRMKVEQPTFVIAAPLSVSVGVLWRVCLREPAEFHTHKVYSENVALGHVTTYVWKISSNNRKWTGRTRQKRCSSSNIWNWNCTKINYPRMMRHSKCITCNLWCNYLTFLQLSLKQWKL